jgi:hypothetical protein
MIFKPGDLVIDTVVNKKAVVIATYEDGDLEVYWIRYVDGGDFNSADAEELVGV